MIVADDTTLGELQAWLTANRSVMRLEIRRSGGPLCMYHVHLQSRGNIGPLTSTAHSVSLSIAITEAIRLATRTL